MSASGAGAAGRSDDGAVAGMSAFGGASAAPAAGGGAGLAPAGGSADMGAAGATVMDTGPCTLWPATPTGTLSEFTLGGASVRDGEHDCAWVLGNSVELPTPVKDSRLVFHYDVNGDGVDDLFVASPSVTMTQHYQDPGPPGLTMLASHLDGGELSFQPTGCTLAWPTDRPYRLRDLDGDGVPDFIVNKTNGIQVLVNRPDGPVVSIDYDFAAPSVATPSASIIDAVLGQFDGDGTTELAVSFSRSEDPPNARQVGTLLFRDPGSPTADHAPRVLVASDWTGTDVDNTKDLQQGPIAALRAGTTLFTVASFSGWLYDGALTKLQNPKYQYGSIFDQSYPEVSLLAPVRVGQRDLVLAALYASVEFFDPWTNEDVASFATRATGPNYSVLDLDGDGDDDLVEIGGPNPEAYGLYVHNATADSGPAAAYSDLAPRNYRDPGSETPFLGSGRAQGRLFVTGADWQLPDTFPIRVTALGCGP